MTRRGFFALVAAAVAVRRLPAPDLSDWTVTIETGPSYVHESLFMLEQQLTLEEFKAAYLDPAVRAIMDSMDRELCSLYYPSRMQLRFDPRRLPA